MHNPSELEHYKRLKSTSSIPNLSGLQVKPFIVTALRSSDVSTPKLFETNYEPQCCQATASNHPSETRIQVKTLMSEEMSWRSGRLESYGEDDETPVDRFRPSTFAEQTYSHQAGQDGSAYEDEPGEVEEWGETVKSRPLEERITAASSYNSRQTSQRQFGLDGAVQFSLVFHSLIPQNF